MDNSFHSALLSSNPFWEKFFNQQLSSFDRLSEVGAGQVIYELRKQIQKLTSELKKLDSSTPEMPELIESANLLRSNKHLSETNSKRSELISNYMQYSKELEKMLATVFEFFDILASELFLFLING